METLGLNDIKNFNIRFDFYTENVSYDDSADLYYFYNNDKKFIFIYLKNDNLLLINDKKYKGLIKILGNLIVENYIIDLMKNLLNNKNIKLDITDENI